MIEITEDCISKVEKILAGIPKGAERVFSNSINRGLSRVKTGATKQVKQVYTVQSSAFTSSANIKIGKASVSNLAGYVSFSGCKIPLYKFKVTPKVPGTGKRVSATVMRGGGATFEDAFIANMNHGTGVFVRETSKRFPVEELMGLSSAQMVGNEKVLAEVEKEAQKLMDERIEHEIDRLLNGYGG